MNSLLTVFANKVLWAGAGAWVLAQVIKLLLEYMRHRRWQWSLLVSAGGMPSSHTALTTGVAVSAGLLAGWDSPAFALAWILTVVVTYDAMGVRRQAGDHARVLNLMIDELLTGHPLAEKELKEVLGHTLREVVAGMLLGIVFAVVLVKVIWR